MLFKFKVYSFLVLFASIIIANCENQLCEIKNLECFETAETEYERWQCFGEHIYRYTDEPNKVGFMEHDCGGVGWGNSIRAFYNVFGMAALLNRRVLVRFNTMFKLWDPPYNLSQWNNGIIDSNQLKDTSVFNKAHEIWDYEKYGREDQIPRFDNWLSSLSRGDEETWKVYNKTHIVSTGVCAGVASIIIKGDCISTLLKNYGNCASARNQQRLSEEQLLVPFFAMTFAKPSQLMVSTLIEIRRRLSLPQLPIGFEQPNPGAYGLYSPGYYILAFHFRRVPLGFEPLSTELNSDSNLPRKVEMLSAYWYNAKKFAKQARKIARCRNETLLIYFATDDIHNLRPEAKRKLSSYGKVVFGLLESEVGHVSPMWRSVDNEEILQRANELKGRGIKRSDMIGSDTTKINVDVNMEGDTDLVMKYDQSAEATEKHGIMSLVEWWILGNSQWLVSHSGTSYSDTSAGWGFSPHGKMERLDIIHSKDHYSTSFRRNWESDTCAHMGAADPEQSQSCPNIRK